MKYSMHKITNSAGALRIYAKRETSLCRFFVGGKIAISERVYGMVLSQWVRVWMLKMSKLYVSRRNFW